MSYVMIMTTYINDFSTLYFWKCKILLVRCMHASGDNWLIIPDTTTICILYK